MQAIVPGTRHPDGATVTVHAQHSPEQESSSASDQRLTVAADDQNASGKRVPPAVARERRLLAYIEYSVDPTTGETTARIRDVRTGEVIREVEVTLLHHASDGSGALGVLLDNLV